MAVVALRTSTTNADGLVQYYGKDEATVTRAGAYSDVTGGRHTVEVVVALASLPTVASGNQQILDDTVVIPKNAVIDFVSVFVEKETAGANANFNLGLVKTDRSTEIDFDGLLAAADVFNSGTDLGAITRYERVDGSLTTEGGALIGKTIGTNPGLLVGWADTGDFTAGVLRVQVVFHVPLTADI